MYVCLPIGSVTGKNEWLKSSEWSTTCCYRRFECYRYFIKVGASCWIKLTKFYMYLNRPSSNKRKYRSCSFCRRRRISVNGWYFNIYNVVINAVFIAVKYKESNVTEIRLFCSDSIPKFDTDICLWTWLTTSNCAYYG